MIAGQASDPIVLIAIAAFGVAIAGIALLLVMSARSVNMHLTNATKLRGPVPVRAADAAKPRASEPASGADAAPGVIGTVAASKAHATANTAQVAQANRADADADADGSRQIFAQLNEYYAANVIQGNTIFWASLLSMIVGFAFITFGIFKAGASAPTAIVAGVAGVFSQFIAATFLVALRSTQEQSTTYAQTLAQLRMRDMRAAADAQSVALGLSLLNEIAADGADALANQTRAAIAMGLIVKNGPPPASLDPAAPSQQIFSAAADQQAPSRAGAISFDSAESTVAPRVPER